MKTGFLPASPAALQRALWEKDSDWLMVGLCCGDRAQFINSEQRNGVIPFTTRIIKAIILTGSFCSKLLYKKY